MYLESFVAKLRMEKRSSAAKLKKDGDVFSMRLETCDTFERARMCEAAFSRPEVGFERD